MKTKRSLKRSDRALVQGVIVTWITICTVFCLIPLFITIINALKHNDDVLYNIFSMPKIFGLGKNFAHNFSCAWDAIKDAFFRSLFVTTAGALIDVAIGALLGYIFTYKEFPFKETIFMIFISIMLLPSIMGMPILVPFMKKELNLYDTYLGYLLPIVGGGQVIGMFLFKTFFAQQPKSLYESAKLDGANDFILITRITIPLAFPIILYHFIGSFSGIYNEYLWASLILRENQTLTSLMHSLVSSNVTEYGESYAMYVISSFPLIITTIISMKYFKSGEFAAGLKL